MAVTKKIIGRIPICFGTWYAKQGGWGIKNRVTLYGSEFESLHDANTVPPAVYDDVENTVTFNENDWRIISNGTDAWLADAKIDALGTWEETNPEFIGVYLDKNGRLLFGIQKDGNFLFGAGCPQQVIDYVKNYVETYVNGSLEDIKAFLAGLDEDGTLKEYLEDYYGYYDENPEFIEVNLDANGCILWGIRKNGDIIFGCGIPSQIQHAISTIHKYLNDNFADIEGTFHYESNPEYIMVALDGEDKFLYGVTRQGKFRVGEFDNLPEEVAKWLNDYFLQIEDPEERMDIELDGEDKILSYRDKKGVKHETNLKIENDLSLSDEAMARFHQALKNSGFNPGGGNDWSDYSTNDGKEPITIPTPKCAMLNIINDADLTALSKIGRDDAREGINYDIPSQIEFWDMNGNYFKKNALISGQGRRSLAFPKKNIAIDLFDSEIDGDAFGIIFGEWVSQDSFHLKAYYTEAFRGIGTVCYKLYKEIIDTNLIDANRSYKKYLSNIRDWSDGTEEDSAFTEVSNNYDESALCFPDGFPVIVYQNDEFYGVFAFQLKKHRDNYHLDKGNGNNIHLDGVINESTLFLANGSATQINWDTSPTAGFEVRNPKADKKASKSYLFLQSDGTPYDADLNYGEIMGKYMNGADGKPDSTRPNPYYDDSNKNHKVCNKAKDAILKLSTYIPELRQMESEEAPVSEIKARIAEMFDVQYMIDYIIFTGIIGDGDGWSANWQWTTYDGNKWVVNPYDLDGVFGYNHIGVTLGKQASGVGGNNLNIPTGWIWKYFLNDTKANDGISGLKERYKELRDKHIIDAQHITSMLIDWVKRIGVDNFKLEFKKWDETPAYRKSYINTEYWEFVNNAGTAEVNYNSSTPYNIGDEVVIGGGPNDRYRFKCIKACTGEAPYTKTYKKYPLYLGHFDSPYRVMDWLEKTIENADETYNYHS